MVGVLPENELERAARALAGARHAVALTGAGLSVESGIPPFRGPGGIWTRHGEPPMNGFERFLADPAAAWRERLSPSGPMKELWDRIRSARPNPGHEALAAMEAEGFLRSLITQNVDGLHTRAGSVQVAEIHGNALLVRCLVCSRRRPLAEVDTRELPPLCDDCGGLLKSDTVAFGEPIPADVLARCEAEASSCDCMLVAGTSATVYPAALLPMEVRRRGGTLVEVNPEAGNLSASCSISLRGPAGEVLPALLAALRRRRDRS